MTAQGFRTYSLHNDGSVNDLKINVIFSGKALALHSAYFLEETKIF